MGTFHRAAGALAVGLAVLTGCGSASTATSSSSPPTSANWTWTAFNSVTTVHVLHPVSWRLVAPPGPTPAPWRTIGYFTNEPTHAPCVTKPFGGGFQITCNGPVSDLSPGGVMVTVSESDMAPGGRQATNATIDGKRVDLQTAAKLQGCPAGTTGRETVGADLTYPRSTPAGLRGTFTVDACYNASGSGASVAAAVDRMVRGIHFR